MAVTNQHHYLQKIIDAAVKEVATYVSYQKYKKLQRKGFRKWLRRKKSNGPSAGR